MTYVVDTMNLCKCSVLQAELTDKKDSFIIPKGKLNFQLAANACNERLGADTFLTSISSQEDFTKIGLI